jgi:hypothetical protein
MKKKIYYRPGMISLIGLPLLVWICLLPHRPQQHWYYRQPLRLLLPSDKRNTYGYSKFSVLREIRGKKILDVDLNETWPPGPDSLFQEQRKDFIMKTILELQLLHDTSTVLKVDFGENNRYGDFIWLINKAHPYMVRRYAFFDDSFYLFANPRPHPTPPDSTFSPIYL